MKLDDEALTCDMAETYHIYNMRAVPLSKVAVLVSGLRENSRIKMKINGMNQPIEVLLLASCLDRLSLLWWAKTTDAEKNRNRPVSMFDVLNGTVKEDDHSDNESFDSGEEFMKRWIELGGGQINE